MEKLILSVIVLGAVLPAYAHRGGDELSKGSLEDKGTSISTHNDDKKYEGGSVFHPESSDKDKDKGDEDDYGHGGKKNEDDDKNHQGGGECKPPSNVPEPVSLSLVVLGGLALIRRRK